jgi:hypothetical protein
VIAEYLPVVPVFVLVTVVAAYASLSKKLSSVTKRISHLEIVVKDLCDDD